MYAYVVFTQMAAINVAWHQNARLAVGLHRYRAQHGRFPEKLRELVPEFLEAVPRDPFDGKEMKLKSDDQGIVVYSIGPNMVDDGGVNGKGIADPNPGDIPLQLSGTKEGAVEQVVQQAPAHE
jgi:hypothetical protein